MHLAGIQGQKSHGKNLNLIMSKIAYIQKITDYESLISEFIRAKAAQTLFRTSIELTSPPLTFYS
jgi:hypothetical protein